MDGVLFVGIAGADGVVAGAKAAMAATVASAIPTVSIYLNFHTLITYYCLS